MKNTHTLLDQFILSLEMRGLRPLSINYYRSYVTRFIEITGCDIEDLGDPERFEQAYMVLWKRDITNETRKKYLKCIRIFSDFLLKKRVIEANCAREIKGPRTQMQLPVSLKDGEIGEIMDAIDEYWGAERDTRGHSRHWIDKWNIAERNRMIVMVLLYTGIRRNEIVNIKVGDCGEKEIFIREGKGGKSRVVYIPEWLGNMIQEFIKKANPDMYLFEGMREQSKLCPRTINTIFKKIKDVSGLQNIYPHKFRHTYATECIKNGINIHTLQRQLGHSNIKTTSLYISICDEDRMREVQSIRNKFSFSYSML